MSTVYVTTVHDGVEIKGPYNEDFKEALKQHIPWQFREWRPEKKVWWVRSDYIADAITICNHYYDHVVRSSYEHEEKPPPPPPKRPSSKQYKGPHATLYLLPEAPTEVVKAAYRALSKKLHPDLGGSNGEMQELNRAYKEITDT